VNFQSFGPSIIFEKVPVKPKIDEPLKAIRATSRPPGRNLDTQLERARRARAFYVTLSKARHLCPKIDLDMDLAESRLWMTSEKRPVGPDTQCCRGSASLSRPWAPFHLILRPQNYSASQASLPSPCGTQNMSEYLPLCSPA
jgi:hypothetical protein